MESLKNRLQTLGISGREAEVYIALLHKEELTAPEIAKISTVSLSKVYEVLQNLVKKSMCNENYKDGLKVFSAIEPKIALENILSVYETDLKNKKLSAQGLEKSLTSIYENKEYKEHPLDFIEIISDIGQLKERFVSIELNTKKEILGFMKSPYAIHPDDNFDNQAKIQKTSIQKGIYECNNIQTQDEKNKLIKTIRACQNHGEEVRLIKELPMKLVISDETVTMFSLPVTSAFKSRLTALIINHPAFAINFKIIFEMYWDKGMTLEEYEEQDLFEEEPGKQIL
ncbi:MAG: hypothetical protein NTV87_17935 [Ignavibacteriae bacterium]|nr:hypothetical protein [Ignavibacteriota bacterium]